MPDQTPPRPNYCPSTSKPHQQMDLGIRFPMDEIWGNVLHPQHKGPWLGLVCPPTPMRTELRKATVLGGLLAAPAASRLS